MERLKWHFSQEKKTKHWNRQNNVHHFLPDRNKQNPQIQLQQQKFTSSHYYRFSLTEITEQNVWKDLTLSPANHWPVPRNLSTCFSFSAACLIKPGIKDSFTSHRTQIFSKHNVNSQSPSGNMPSCGMKDLRIKSPCRQVYWSQQLLWYTTHAYDSA